MNLCPCHGPLSCFGGSATSVCRQSAAACKHDVNFRFLRCEAADRLPGVWTCPKGCGYTMNFSPDHYPFGVAYREEPVATKIILLKGPEGVPP